MLVLYYAGNMYRPWDKDKIALQQGQEPFLASFALRLNPNTIKNF
jgi:hypothetical protein